MDYKLFSPMKRGCMNPPFLDRCSAQQTNKLESLAGVAFYLNIFLLFPFQIPLTNPYGFMGRTHEPQHFIQ